jgi:hypothetical protein
MMDHDHCQKCGWPVGAPRPCPFCSERVSRFANLGGWCGCCPLPLDQQNSIVTRFADIVGDERTALETSQPHDSPVGMLIRTMAMR